MDLQHCMAVGLANILDDNKEQDTEEKLLLVYGIEVFLNEFLKIACAWLLAWGVGELPLVIFGTIYLILLRRYAGGKHFKSNAACFIFSVFSLVPVPILGGNIHFSFMFQAGIFLSSVLLFWRFAPAKIEKNVSEKDRLRKKWTTLVIYVFGVLFAWIIGKEAYVNAMLLIGLIASVATIEKR